MFFQINKLVGQGEICFSFLEHCQNVSMLIILHHGCPKLEGFKILTYRIKGCLDRCDKLGLRLLKPITWNFVYTYLVHEISKIKTILCLCDHHCFFRRKVLHYGDRKKPNEIVQRHLLRKSFGPYLEEEKSHVAMFRQWIFNNWQN
jgi:hypothetical protein